MQNFKIRQSRDGRARYLYYPAESGRMVKLEVSHRDGGMNYFSGRTEKRGIEIVITTIELSDQGRGMTMESSTPMNDENGRMMLVETPRYSARKLEKIATAIDARAPEISATWSADREGAKRLLVDIGQEMVRLAA
jgi:hypothetical protein